jgi:internalin A
MTPEEDDYQEALRRIKEAEVELDLGGLALNRLPRELASLTSLQSLDLSECKQLSDLSPLASLTSLQGLNLYRCEQLSDLSPLASLTSLLELDLFACKQLSDLSPLASLTSLQRLILAWCGQLGDLSPLVSLTSLQSLDLSECEQLSGDLSPLASLTSLQSLNLYACKQLSGDLSPLSGLTSLQSLNLGGCVGVRRFTPLEPLLPAPCLGEGRIGDQHNGRGLYSGRFRSNRRRLQGGDHPACSHIGRASATGRVSATLKVFFLGNGGVGKTQLCRRLRNLDFDPSVPTTHGVQLGETTVDLEGFAEPVRLNLWDFGGQDIYSRFARAFPSWTCRLSPALGTGARAPNGLPGRLTLFASSPSFLLGRLPLRLCRYKCFHADRSKPMRFGSRSHPASAR